MLSADTLASLKLAAPAPAPAVPASTPTPIAPLDLGELDGASPPLAPPSSPASPLEHLEQALAAAEARLVLAAAAVVDAREAFASSGGNDAAWQQVQAAELGEARARLARDQAKARLASERDALARAELDAKRARIAALRVALSDEGIARRIEPYVPQLAAVLEQLAAAMPPMGELIDSVSADARELAALCRATGDAGHDVAFVLPHRLPQAESFMCALLSRRLEQHAEAKGLRPTRADYLNRSPLPPPGARRDMVPGWLVKG